MSVLSSNKLNDLLSQKDFDSYINYVSEHFQSHNEDIVSVSKFLSSLAYHLYHVTSTDPTKFATILEISLEVLINCFRKQNLPNETIVKITTTLINILYISYFKNFHFKESTMIIGYFIKIADLSNNFYLQRSLQESQNLITTTIFILKLKNPTITKIIRKLYLDHKLNIAQSEVRLSLLYRLHILIQCRLMEYQVVEEVISNILNFMSDVLQHCNFIIKNKLQKFNDITEATLNIYIKCASLLMKNNQEVALKILLNVKDFLQEHMKAKSAFLPTTSLLRVYNILFDIYYENDNFDKAEVLVDDSLDVIYYLELNSLSDFTLDLFKVNGMFSKWRLLYESIMRKVYYEKLKSSDIQMKETPGQKDEVESEFILKVGDSNPFSQNINLDNESNLQNLAKDLLDVLNKSYKRENKTIQAYWTQNSLLRIIFSIAEYFGITGNLQLFKESHDILLKFSKEFKSLRYQCYAIHGLLFLNIDEELNKLDSNFHTVQKDEDYKLLIYLGLARNLFRANKKKESFELVNFVNEYLKDKASLPHWIISTETKTLLADLLSTLPYDCDYASSNNVLDLLSLANRDIKSCEVHHGKIKPQTNTWFTEMLRISQNSINHSSDKIELLCRAGLLKDLRSYADMQLQYCEKFALTIRTVEALIEMVDIDLQCDNPEQAIGKLFGIKRIIQPLLSNNNEECDNKRIRVKPTNDDDLGSSPKLYGESFSIPDLFYHENCDCFGCSNPLILLLIIHYFNLLGVRFHMTKNFNSAYIYFEGVKKIITLMEDKLENDTMKYYYEKAYYLFFRLFKWQILCLCRQKQFNEAKEILEDERRCMNKIPNYYRRYPHIKLSYTKQIEYLYADNIISNNDNDQEVESLTNFLNVSTLDNDRNYRSPTPEHLNCHEESFIEKTPETKKIPSMPKKPNKRILRPRNPINYSQF